MGEYETNLKTKHHDLILFNRFVKDKILLDKICKKESIIIQDVNTKNFKNIQNKKRFKKNIFK